MHHVKVCREAGKDEACYKSVWKRIAAKSQPLMTQDPTNALLHPFLLMNDWLYSVPGLKVIPTTVSRRSLRYVYIHLGKLIVAFRQRW